MKVLVTGAAGFIGSTVALALLDAGDEVVGLDDLSRGPAAFLRHFPSFVGDAADNALLQRIFAEHPDISAAVHCAARTMVTESITDPVGYYRANVATTIAFLDHLLARGCTRLVFSSSAAVYGTVSDPVITEQTATDPQNPYAAGKLMVERLLADVCAATPLTAISMRYFNPIGSDPRHRTGPHDPGPLDAMGSLLTAGANGNTFWIHGDDWPTPDGTPVRDFIHVWDLALAHVAALHRWDAVTAQGPHVVMNIGSGQGTSVRELVDAFNSVAPRAVEVRYDGRRTGDVAGGYAPSERARRLLQWQPERSTVDGVRDAVVWAAAFRDQTGRR